MKISLKRLHPKGTSVDTVSYQDIKQCFTTNPPDKVPTAKALKESDCVMVYSFCDTQGRYTIFNNGLVIYEYAEERWISGCPKIKQRVTVIPTHRMSFTYETRPDANTIGGLTIPESEYNFMPFRKVLQMFAIIRIQHNENSRNDRNILLILNDTDTAKEFATTDCPELLEIENKIDYKPLYEAIDSLSDKQKCVLQLYYNKELTQNQIADILGITRSGVNSHLIYAKANLKKQEYLKKLL